eukprot:897944-Lingulodinium_polyedra.AAC.1
MQYAVEKTMYDECKWQRVVQCRESASCPVNTTLTYHAQAAALPANTFVVVTSGDHEHSAPGAASGK